MNKKIMSAMNAQVNREFYAAYLYLALSAYYSSINLDGFASWMREQAKEEISHAMKFYDYIFERGGVVTLDAIEKPKLKLKGILEPFEAALAHEKKVTAWIYEIADLVYAEKDYASYSLIQWFIIEQVEEENNTSGICEKIKMIGNDKVALFILNKELSKRS